MAMNSPKETAEVCVNVGKAKTSNSIVKLLLLGFMAGAFIAFGGVGANTVSATITNGSVAKACGAMIFPAGLAMVLIAGSELFTGNSLISVSVLNKDVKASAMIKNWVCVYIGNFIGSVFVAWLCFVANQYGLFNNAVAVNTIGVAASKCSLQFGPALASGILCNILVCIAVWMSFAAKQVADKIIAIYLPIVAFVLAGFEHCVANMYFIPAGIFAASNPTYAAAAVEAGKNLANLTWGNMFVTNLLPVTIGNIIGGCIVGLVYWLIYLNGSKKAAS